MAFLDELAAVAHDPARQIALVKTWMVTQPKELYDELRLQRPILALPQFVLVTRYRDVIDVLARDREFGVTYAPKMQRATGDFFLGMDDGPAYEREVSIMRLASHRDDLPHLAKSIGEWAEACVAEKACTGRLDVVGDVARRVPCRLVTDYFGVSGVGEATLLRWLRALFRDIFRNPGDREAGVKEAAANAARELGAHLESLVSQLSNAQDARSCRPDTVLARCVRLQATAETALDAAGIRRNIAGLIVGAVETTSECVANAIDYLLDHPELLVQASAAARDDRLDEVRAYVFEALRFKPQAPVLTRTALASCVLGRGTAHETPIQKGSVVVVALMSAMADPDELDAPESFALSRPDRHYLHFGDGMHRCFGRHINRIQLPLIAQAILRLPGLHRAPGEDGRLTLDGPFPDRLVVEFDRTGK